MARALAAGLLLLAGAVPAAEGLRLVGTVALGPGGGAPSHAVFETGDGRQLIVDAGQSVDGCRLEAVLRRRVRMACAGGLVTLFLEAGPVQPAPPAGAPPMTVYSLSLPREDFLLAVADRQRVASQVSLVPAVAGDRLYGYQVEWVRAGGDFHRLGLSPGDVLVALNGVPAGDPGAFMQALGGLGGQRAFELTVVRDGAPISYRYLLE